MITFFNQSLGRQIKSDSNRVLVHKGSPFLHIERLASQIVTHMLYARIVGEKFDRAALARVPAQFFVIFSDVPVQVADLQKSLIYK